MIQFVESFKMFRGLMAKPVSINGVTGNMKRNRSLILLLALLLGLSGCTFRSVDELYLLPRPSESFVNLQAAIDQIKGSAESIAPTSGNRTQAIQLYDLLMDGKQEAIAFFRDNSAERPLKIAIFQQTDEGDYILYAMIEGAGSDIGSIEYVDLTGDGVLELVVSWQSATVYNLVAYSIENGQVAELMRSGYTRYLTADLNEDGKSEIYLAQIDSSTGNNRLEMYVGDGSIMQLYTTVSMSDGVVPVMERGSLQGGEPALFITMEFGDNYRVTDVFSHADSSVKNITMDESTRRSTAVRVYTGLSVTDIDGDGVTEVPISARIHTPDAATGENFWSIQWKQFDKEGSEHSVLRTYHNIADRWYLVLPENWAGKITLSRTENTALGERAVVFSYWEGDPEIPPENFLTIYRLTGTNREMHAAIGSRFSLELPYQDPDVVFAAEFHACSWEHGLDQIAVRERFHAIMN